MPRIAAAVGLFVLAVFSIGFNMARYPAVWEMVGVSSHLLQAHESSPPATVAETAAVARPAAVAETTAASLPEAAVKSIMPWQVAPVASTGEETLVAVPAPESVAEAEDGRAGEVPPPEEAKPTPKYASPAESRRGLDESKSGKPLVPLVRPPVTQDLSGSARYCSEVRRLPPVTQGDPVPADRLETPSPGGPIPFYPTTGTN